MKSKKITLQKQNTFVSKTLTEMNSKKKTPQYLSIWKIVCIIISFLETI